MVDWYRHCWRASVDLDDLGDAGHLEGVFHHGKPHYRRLEGLVLHVLLPDSSDSSREGNRMRVATSMIWMPSAGAAICHARDNSTDLTEPKVNKKDGDTLSQ
mmetsp:Transcript_76499/g.147710  ORF Transcript_76499/g.147710 Transcript_76499/m.147710 type:complete len:102 (+) Transcript_76499:290-595(+)